jgi:hypothetical protein
MYYLGHAFPQASNPDRAGKSGMGGNGGGCPRRPGATTFHAAERTQVLRARTASPPEYVEAYSWMARAALSARDYDQAADYAKQTKALALEQLKQRPLDAEPHLPIGLGAAIEVQSQVLAARGQRTKAVAVLQTALHTYGNTSIRARLQKNLNLLSFEGRPAPRSTAPSNSWDRSRRCLPNSRVRRCCFFSGHTGVETAKRKRLSSRNCAPNLRRRD